MTLGQEAFADNQSNAVPAAKNTCTVVRRILIWIFVSRTAQELEKTSIHIIVKNGHVTLEGFVDSQQDKDAATLHAKGVPNVFSVDNHLIVTDQSNR